MKEKLGITVEADLVLSDKAPQCLQCMHNIGDGACYRKNDGKAVPQLQTPCSSRYIYQNCATCNKTIGEDCHRKKHVGIGICRADWIINPYFDLKRT